MPTSLDVGPRSSSCLPCVRLAALALSVGWATQAGATVAASLGGAPMEDAWSFATGLLAGAAAALSPAAQARTWRGWGTADDVRLVLSFAAGLVATVAMPLTLSRDCLATGTAEAAIAVGATAWTLAKLFGSPFLTPGPKRA